MALLGFPAVLDGGEALGGLKVQIRTAADCYPALVIGAYVFIETGELTRRIG